MNNKTYTKSEHKDGKFRDGCSWIEKKEEAYWAKKRPELKWVVMPKMMLLGSYNKSYAEQTEGGKTEICTTGPIEEGVDRLTALLGELMRSHALLEGRNTVNDSDLALAVDVAFSSLPDDRRIAVELLISSDGEYKDSTLAEKLSGTTRSAQ